MSAHGHKDQNKQIFWKPHNLAIQDRFSKDYTKALRSMQHLRVFV
jgi:hypothetical protein